MHQFQKDPLIPFTDAEIRDLGLDEIDGLVVAVSLKELNSNPLVLASVGMFALPHVSPKLHNLIFAAPFMYRALCHHFVALEQMITQLELVSASLVKSEVQPPLFLKQMTDHMNELQTFITDMCRTATEGAEKVAKELRESVDK